MRICYVVTSTENKVFGRDECTQFVHFILFLLQMLHLYMKGKKSHFFPSNQWSASTKIYSLNLISISVVRSYWHAKWNRSVWKNISTFYWIVKNSSGLLSKRWYLPGGFVWFGIRVKFLWGEFNLTMIIVVANRFSWFWRWCLVKIFCMSVIFFECLQGSIWI